MLKTKTVKPNPLEREVQKAICQYLDMMGIVYSKTDASRTFSHDGKPRRSKVTPDWPDLTAVMPMQAELSNGNIFTVGVAFFVECKRERGSPVRPGQKERLSQLRSKGAIAIVARNVKDVEDVVKLYFNRPLVTLVSEVLPKFAWELLPDVAESQLPLVTVSAFAQSIKLPSVSQFPDRVQRLIRDRNRDRNKERRRHSS